MAIIHDTLYKTKNFSHVNMGLYLTKLTDQIAGSYYSENSIRIIINAKGIHLDLYQATPCDLIVNELVTNSFKYAFPPSFDCEAVRPEPCTLRISLTLNNGYYNLIIGDNGVGLPADFDPLAATSPGLKLVNFIAKHQLKAKIKVNTTKGTEHSNRFSEPAVLPKYS